MWKEACIKLLNFMFQINTDLLNFVFFTKIWTVFNNNKKDNMRLIILLWFLKIMWHWKLE